MAMDFFSIESIFFEIWGYPMSYLEFFGTVSGVIAVWLAARANIWSWPIGVVNVTLSFFLFFQVQLYPDMFLQVFYFVTNLLGWWRWAHPSPEEEDKKRELRISFMPVRQLIIFSSIGVLGTIVMGGFSSNLHQWFPIIFNRPSAYPYLDSFVTVMSIVATYLMIQKKVECWMVWMVVDMVATGLYFAKDIKMYSALYLAFCFIAAFGLWKWMKEYKSYSLTS